ncbi:MAG: hypothetical protein KC502_22190 [Myxococcales bacterium]|nr:hypothetical protein [Myxococcales bacterium]
MSRASTSARSRRGQTPKKQISTDEQKFLEGALAALPEGPSQAGNGFADDLLKFSYHQNPYMRTFTKVLWSGFALSRGQVVECHTRFKQAHRDATMSNIDQVTVRALDEAASSLDAALAPDGSVSLFLGELRGRTMQRIWARVCETSMLPPPSFSRIYGDEAEMTEEEMDAAEAAELAELLKNPEDLAELTGVAVANDESAEAADAADAGDDAGEVAAAPAAAEGDAAGGDTSEAASEDGESAEPAEASFELEMRRSGSAEQAPELLLAAASDLLRELRGKAPNGQLKITVRVEGVGQGGNKKRGRRRRRRR